ncbi:MAG: hypothetical protein AVDCRST_MAG15-642 [uncultured Rubellimicrobium sp.]|uniref:Uncharacterized protein n=1 Tax=uncultured Rubellimicrobium sp. TaxID=543078 RepID=A0A6J4NMM6_9RHOB|nr:MAG: hypothetical protein AVDCRST_MAG15-642 [uncultured Rubellimicrobium sp.]
MSGDGSTEGQALRPEGITPAPDPVRPRFLGTADPTPEPLGGLTPDTPAERLAEARLKHPQGRPVMVEFPADPDALSPAAVEALAAIVDLLDGEGS